MNERHAGLSDESWLVSGGRPTEPGAPLSTPPVPASNYLLGAGVSYARGDATPTCDALERLLGGLEGGRTVCFASGMAAVSAVFDQLPPGAKVVVPDDCYQGVAGLAAEGAARGRWRLHHLPITDTASWEAAAGEADLLWVESPSNPLLQVADLRAIGRAERRPGCVLAVDNTFATPLNQRPLDLGADVSVQSVTKLIGGHADLVVGAATTRRPDLVGGFERSRVLLGAVPGALECYLAVRGARTLRLRLTRSEESALVLAERLSAHPQVERVRYPGLPSDPGHELSSAQLAGHGSVVTFDVVGGAAAADATCAGTHLIRHATSLGGVESTMERRAALAGQEHLPPGLIRLSVGIEAATDLWDDLDAALLATRP